jgi:hypothetical protein
MKLRLHPVEALDEVGLQELADIQPLGLTVATNSPEPGLEFWQLIRQLANAGQADFLQDLTRSFAGTLSQESHYRKQGCLNFLLFHDLT